MMRPESGLITALGVVGTSAALIGLALIVLALWRDR